MKFSGQTTTLTNLTYCTLLLTVYHAKPGLYLYSASKPCCTPYNVIIILHLVVLFAEKSR